MEKKLKMLYVEDMQKCYDKTAEVFRNSVEIDWRKSTLEAIDAIYSHPEKYDFAVFDVNLFYNPNKTDKEQSKEGLALIWMLREELKARGINSNLPIFCVSSDGENKPLSIENGATAFLWKKQFWEDKKNTLENLVAQTVFLKENGRQKR
ncbi:MAG: hypothetical protein ABIH28_03830 [archaeon]